MKRIIGFNRSFVMIVTSLLLLLVWIYPSVAFAQVLGGTTGSIAGDLLMLVLKLALVAVSVLGSFLIGKGITYFEKKTNIDLPRATEDMIFGWADQAIGLATEKAHQVLQNEGKILGGNEKMNIALQFVLDIATKYNLEGLVADKLRNYIDSKLGSKRLDKAITASPISDTVVITK